jgi:hypothetical protein
MSDTKTGLDKAALIISIFSGVVLPVAVLLIGYQVSTAENNIKFVEIAISVLRDAPSAGNPPDFHWT